MSTTTERPARVDRHVDDDLDHVICCVDHNLTFCRRDATRLPWVDTNDHPCIVCETLDDHGYCPHFGVCPEDDE